MIATCPACGKRYRIADDAVPPGGREVRCAACSHGWTVVPDGGGAHPALPPAAAPPPIPAAQAPSPPVAPPSFFAAGLPRVASPAVAQTAAGSSDAPVSPRSAAVRADEVAATGDPAWSPDATADDTPRRRYGWLVAVLLVVAGVAALAVVEFAPAATFDPPRLGLPAPDALGLPTVALGDVPPLDLTRVPLVGDALDRLVHPPAAPASPLRVSASGVRSTLGNGTRVLTVSGTVANPTDAAVALAGIDAALVDPAGGAPFRWRIAAPASVIAAHGSAAFESIAANYPAGATVLRTTPR